MLAVRKLGRHDVIAALRSQFSESQAAGGFLNLPLYNWHSLFTTNFDNLIEQGYRSRNLLVNIFSFNFDFTIHKQPFGCTAI